MFEILIFPVNGSIVLEYAILRRLIFLLYIFTEIYVADANVKFGLFLSILYKIYYSTWIDCFYKLFHSILESV